MDDSTCAPDTDLVALAKGVDIDVIASDVAGTIKWSLDIKTSGHGKDNKIELEKDHNYIMTFTLLDRTRLNLRFDASGPFFARDGGAGPCPTNISTAQIMVDSCEAKKLVVMDWNYGAPTELYYQLNFVNETGKDDCHYDPPIVNGGGGTKPMMIA